MPFLACEKKKERQKRRKIKCRRIQNKASSSFFSYLYTYIEDLSFEMRGMGDTFYVCEWKAFLCTEASYTNLSRHQERWFFPRLYFSFSSCGVSYVCWAFFIWPSYAYATYRKVHRTFWRRTHSTAHVILYIYIGLPIRSRGTGHRSGLIALLSMHFVCV